MKRRILKEISLFLLVLLLIPLSLTGCAQEKPPLDVALVLKTSVGCAEFWAQVMDGVNSAAQEFGINLSVSGSSAESEIDEQIEIMEDVIESGPDVIVLAAADYERLVPSVEKAADAGIRVITLDSDVNSPIRATCVASNNYQIGREMGVQLLQRVPEGEIAILTHSNVSSSGIDRVRGVLDELHTVPDVQIVGVYDCSNDPATAGAIAGHLLNLYPELKGFVCVNENANIGVADRLVRGGLTGTVTVIGCDSSLQQVQYLEQNATQAIVIQRPFNMGYLAIQQAVRVGRGETVPFTTEIPFVSITQDNMYNLSIQKLLFPF